jgi:hypothetical protein
MNYYGTPSQNFPINQNPARTSREFKDSRTVRKRLAGNEFAAGGLSGTQAVALSFE